MPLHLGSEYAIDTSLQSHIFSFHIPYQCSVFQTVIPEDIAREWKRRGEDDSSALLHTFSSSFSLSCPSTLLIHPTNYFHFVLAQLFLIGTSFSLWKENKTEKRWDLFILV